MDILNGSNIQAAGRLHSHQQLGILIDFARDDGFLLVAAGHAAGNGHTALAGTHIVLLNQVVRILAHFIRLDKAIMLELRLPVALQHHVLFQRVIQHQAVLMAILRDMAHAVLGALADGSVGDVLSIQRDRTAGDFFQTGQAVHQLGLTVALNTGKANDLTRANVKADIAHRIFFMGAAGHRHALHAQDGFAGLGGLFVHHKLNIAANHHAGKLFLAAVGNIHGADILALAQNRAAVRHGHDLVQLVGNKQDALALSLKTAHDLHQFVDFLRSQYSGGFVKNQNFIVTVQHFQDLNALLHANRDIADQCIRVYTQAVFFRKLHDLFAGDLFLQKSRFAGFHTQHDVIQHREALHQLKVLVDHADAKVVCIVGVIDLDFLAVFLDDALFWLVQAEQNTHEGGFAGAVFAQQGMHFAFAQPEAIFVWLSDSPQLNEQSKQKIELKADKVRIDQCVVISDESFDREILEDGHIYFLNTQKLGKAGNLSRHSDTRQYTIWETIENTARQKSDRLYFIIDEAHRGMQGRQAGTATTIMQRFIKGSNEQNLSPIPVVIGMSATADRFNALVGQGTSSTLHKVVISPAQVRQSGLLKDRIVITYPDDPTKHGDMAVLQAATDEWQDKCKHWYQYTYEQHYTNVNPVFVIQVCAGSGTKVSDTDLDDVIAKIEERMGDTFKENEVVHTFGSTGALTIHGLNVPHVEPSEIADNRRIRVVLFKENLSTGWDCPRAETMMSFRRAEDATYIAQLLGRMVRTPLQCHVLVDDSLNDVRLFLPYFNQNTVQKVIDELQATEGGEIPTVVDGESLEEQTYDTWSVHNQRKKTQKQTVGQLSIFDYPNGFQEEPAAALSTAIGDMSNSGAVAANQGGADSEIPAEGQHQTIPLETVSGNDVHAGQETERTSGGNQAVNKEQPVLTPSVSQMSMLPTIDREGITKFINEQGYLTYIVRAVKINSYLKSLMSLAGLLSQFNICITAAEDVKNDVAELIRNYVNGLHDAGKYDELTKQVMEMKLSVQIFDVFGEKIQSDNQIDMFTASESDLDRQLRVADAKMGGCGFHLAYGRKYIDFDNPNAFKVDCILFAFDSECIAKLNKYAEKKFHELNDQYRKYIVAKPEKCQKQYSDIVANGDEISKYNFTLPETISAKVEADGIKYTDHLFANADGIAKIKLNGWEQAVLAEEQKREDYVCWLRNPSRQSWSLRMPYEMDGKCKELYPDFIIVRHDPILKYIVDILEPHNPDFKDNLGKAKGLANYAANEPRIGRVQLIRIGKDAAGENRFKRLDLAKGSIRNKVLAAINTDELDHIFDTDGVFED